MHSDSLSGRDMMPSQGPQSVSTARAFMSASAAEILREYGTEQWQPASVVWQRGKEGQTHQSNMSLVKEEALMGQDYGSHGFILLPSRSGNFIFRPLEFVINIVHPATPLHLLPETPPATAAPHAEAQCGSYQHLALLTHPSSWASSVPNIGTSMLLSLFTCRLASETFEVPLYRWLSWTIH